MRIVLYGNGTCGNHGCEAIVRGTIGLLGIDENTYRIQSENPREDRKYGLGKLAQIFPAKSEHKKDFRFAAAYAKLKLAKDYTDMDGLFYLSSSQEAGSWADIALSIGGDNYCYSGTGIYAYLNRVYKKQGAKTVLWGCSIEPDIVAQKNVEKDLRRYDWIVARESITYEAVKRIQKNTILAPDPAFSMESVECSLDERLNAENVIGINISPMIISNEKRNGMAYENYKHLIQYILSATDAVIALIPHVVWASSDDRKILRQLYDDFHQNSRLVPVKDGSAPELKYIISRCSFFVGARTHATIAAYSSCVPTLAVGYSVKARGIARDLFGTEKGYVLPVQDLSASSQLTAMFQELWFSRNSVRAHLEQMIPTYISNRCHIEQLLKGIYNEE